MQSTFDHKELSEAIQAKRKRGDTLRVISSETGLSIATLSRVLHGNCSSIETALKICDWLEQPITDFIYREGEFFREIPASKLKRRRNNHCQYKI